MVISSFFAWKLSGEKFSSLERVKDKITERKGLAEKRISIESCSLGPYCRRNEQKARCQELVKPIITFKQLSKQHTRGKYPARLLRPRNYSKLNSARGKKQKMTRKLGNRIKGDASLL